MAEGGDIIFEEMVKSVPNGQRDQEERGLEIEERDDKNIENKYPLEEAHGEQSLAVDGESGLCHFEHR